MEWYTIAIIFVYTIIAVAAYGYMKANRIIKPGEETAGAFVAAGWIVLVAYLGGTYLANHTTPKKG